jgi:hypothetical protein
MKQSSSMFTEMLGGIGSRFLHLVAVGVLFGMATAAQHAAIQWFELPALGTGTVLALSALTLLLTALVAAYSHLSTTAPEWHWLRQRVSGFLALDAAVLAVALGGIVLARNDWTSAPALLDILAGSATSAGVLFAMFCSLANGWSLLLRLTASTPGAGRQGRARARSMA